MEIGGITIDDMTILALGLAMCGYVVQKGLADLSAFVMILVTGFAVLKLKAAMPAEALMGLAGLLVAMNVFTAKNSNYIVLLIYAGCLCGSIMVLKLFLPAIIMVRMAISVIFLGILRIVLF